MTRLGAGRVLVGDQLVEADVEVTDGRVVAISEPARGSTTTVAPGFVDLQANGFAGVDFATCASEDLQLAAEALWATGTTAFLPTLVTAPVDALCAGLDVVREVQLSGPLPGRAAVVGAHLEGPFLAELRLGAHDGAHRLDPDLDTLDRLLEAGSGGALRRMTLAPELPGALALVTRLLEHSVAVAAGHSDATSEQAHAGFDAGIASVTHLGNAMAPFHQRNPGLFGASLVRADVTPTLIADGRHVADDTVRLAFAATQGRVALVTDAVSLAGTTDTTARLGAVEITRSEGAAVRPDGSLTGGLLTLADMLQRVIDLGIDPAKALAAVSSHPRRLTRLPHAHGVRVGDPADLVLLDADHGVIEVIDP